VDQRQIVAGVFDRAAETYDRVGVAFFVPIAERLVAELDPRPGERALDVGCGSGVVLVRLARAVGPAGGAVGIDLAPRMVEAARAEAEAAGVSVDVRAGDAQSPDLEPETYDVVASSLVLFFLPDPGAAARAWRRLLVPGGRVGVTTFGEYSPAWRAVDDVFKPYLPQGWQDARTKQRSGPFASDAGVEGLFVDAGFADVRSTTMTVPVRFRDEDHWYLWTWSVGQRAMWEAVPEPRREGVRALAYEQLGRCRDSDGRIGFDQVVRFTLARR
jgi:ubiquinone/menaquinone biosynthesis C-methylase UbiE